MLIFSGKIGYTKNSNSAVSVNGRGLQVNPLSQARKSDFFVALSGRENHSQYTQVTSAIGFDKNFAHTIFSEYAVKKSEVYFDAEKNEFFKEEKLCFENLVLTDYGKTRLSEKESALKWKEFFTNNPQSFLKTHSDYEKIKTKINFILKKQNIYFRINDETQSQIENFELLVCKTILDYYDSFEDYKNCDLFYITYQTVNDELSSILQNLPEQIKSPRGRTATINYTDDKAPLISLKLQEAFGWKDTPRIFNNTIPLTLELLAPNMRPTQTTSHLAQFWKTSYADVRKDLRARYPKHDWPEDPS